MCGSISGGDRCRRLPTSTIDEPPLPEPVAQSVTLSASIPACSRHGGAEDGLRGGGVAVSTASRMFLTRHLPQFRLTRHNRRPIPDTSRTR